MYDRFPIFFENPPRKFFPRSSRVFDYQLYTNGSNIYVVAIVLRLKGFITIHFLVVQTSNNFRTLHRVFFPIKF